MNSRAQILCAWCGILCPIVLFIGLWPGAGFVPPPPPSGSAADIARIYQENAIGIRWGMICMLISAALYLPFVGALAAQMRRMEPRETPVLTYTQLAAGAVASLLNVIPAELWGAAAFRADEHVPETIRLLNDIGWLFFIQVFVLNFVQNFAIGFAVIGDRSPHPVFPRWVGYFNFWVALLFIPAGLLTFFKTGPFAWNGLLPFWVPAVIFGPWFWINSTAVIRAARHQAALHEQGHAP